MSSPENFEQTPTFIGAPRRGSRCLSLAIGLSVFAILTGSLSFWDRTPTSAIVPGSVMISIAALLAIVGWLMNGRRLTGLGIDPISAGWPVVLLFLSDWLTRGYNLLQGPGIRGEVIVFGVLSLLVVLVNSKLTWRVLAFLCSATLVYAFLSTSSGRLIFSDDNPTFLFRLMLLKENFPHIPFFSPLWNGGFDARDFFATGAVNVFLLFSPLIYLFDLSNSFNFISIGLLLVLVPLFSWLAVRLAEYRSPVPEIAAVLALTSSLIWYRWGLKYGTLGFCAATSLALINLILISRMLSGKEYFNIKHAALFTITVTLMVMWSPTGFVLLPALFLALFKARTILANRAAVASCLLILLLNLPWMFAFWQVSSVSAFLTAGTAQHAQITSDKPRTYADSADVDAESDVSPDQRGSAPITTTFKRKKSAPTFGSMLRETREKAISTNPLIALLGLPGIFLLRRRFAIPLGITSAWLLVLGAYLAVALPQLELDRMLVMLAFILVLPTAVAINGLFEQVRSSITEVSAARPLHAFWCVPPLVVTSGMLFAAVFSVSAILSGRSVEQHSFAGPEVEGLSQAIRENSQAGRVLFSGFVLHELSGGHLAPLVFFSDTPLMASSYVHNIWRYRQIFPAHYLGRGDAGIVEYLDTFNVGAVVAHEPFWRSYFSARPEQFTQRWHGGRFVLFSRNSFESSYFLAGNGAVIHQSSSEVKFELATPEATIKFNYFPFLTVVDSQQQLTSCRIAPAKLNEAVTLTAISDCPTGTPLILRSVNILERLGIRD
jgi:hypothetical protein